MSMQSKAKTPEDYISELPEERKEPIRRLRKVILDNLPVGFSEVMSYGMIGYVVPLSIYPKGYHATPNLPLPYINIASQKNYISVYHMALYGDKDLLNWFLKEYSVQCKTKIDMGKGCIRFKKPEQIPFKLIGDLVSKVAVNDYIAKYESLIRR
jgi:hypothetical protein